MTAPSTDAHARLVLRDVSHTLATDGRHVVSRRLWNTIPPRAELIQVAELLDASAERREHLVAEGQERQRWRSSPLVMRAVATLAEREGQTTEEWLRAASAAADDSDCDTNTMEVM